MDGKVNYSMPTITIPERKIDTNHYANGKIWPVED